MNYLKHEESSRSWNVIYPSEAASFVITFTYLLILLDQVRIQEEYIRSCNYPGQWYFMYCHCQALRTCCPICKSFGY